MIPAWANQSNKTINHIYPLLILISMETKVSTGTAEMDWLLEGGYDKGVITTIYGPAGSGKTNICIITAVHIAKQNKKVIYIDTEGSFSVERLKQIAGEDEYKKIIDNIIFLKPTSFSEQRSAFGKLSRLIEADIGIIIVDTISMLYRIEIGKTNDVYTVNKDLGTQISYLNEITRRKDIPVLITNQVYASFDEKENIRLVGGDILKYQSKCLIELQKGHNGIRKAILKKHRSIAEDKVEMFKIVGEGIVEVS